MMPAEGLRSSETPLTEYRVVTEDGRIFSWSAFDYNDLFAQLRRRGHAPIYAKPMGEYEAEVMAREDQERLHHELVKAIEEERKTA
ncbi:hypothetical protein [Paenibacillus pabuli]|uniref:hypothetical protein n=1 Tax=Paenibacillus pabuli TaxID=1472 RepID=UPI001FFE48B0|nr:hypothetical protein [Paenibacillus pabuli]UPK42502.1 hypothetical protein KET34_25435 [Paenibacillus pabuli]